MTDEELQLRIEIAKVRAEHDEASLLLEAMAVRLDRLSKRLEELTVRAASMGIRTSAHELYPDPVKKLKLEIV